MCISSGVGDKGLAEDIEAGKYRLEMGRKQLTMGVSVFFRRNILLLSNKY